MLQVGGGLLVLAFAAHQRVPLGLAVVFLDGVEDFLLGGERGLDLQPGEGPQCRHGFEIQRIGHRHRERGTGHRQRERAALPQEAVRQPVDLRRRGRRLVDRHQRDPELVGKRRQHIALRDQPHVHQDLAQLVAALFLQFQRALQVFGLDLATLPQNLAQSLVAEL